MRVLVVGAGPAGTRCAVALARQDGGAAITLIGEEPGLPYDRVALGRCLAGGASPEALVTEDARALAGLGIAHRPGLRIAGIDRAARQLLAADGSRLDYDALVLATGSRAIRLDLPGAALPGVCLYRSLADVAAMQALASPGAPAVVVGGGLLGLEAAACLAGRGMTVTVVHPLPWPMERQLDAGAGQRLTAALQAQGIAFAMPAAPAAIEGAAAAGGLRLADGRLLPARLVVLAVGVRPEVSLAAAAGLPVGRGILVDAAMRSADPAILAIGECAEFEGACCGLVAPALAQAEVAAAVLAGGARRYAPRPDAAALKVAGISLWSAGRIAPAGAEAITLDDAETGDYRRLWLQDGRLAGAVLYGDVAESGFYLGLITSGRPIAPIRAALALGPDFMEPDFIDPDMQDREAA